MKQKVGGREERQSDRWRWKGEEVNQRGKGETAKARKRRGDSRARQKAENKWQWGRKYTRGKMRGTKVQRDTMTAEGKEREDRLRRSYISNTPNGKPHNSNIFFSKSTVSREGKSHRKAATETLREENERERGRGKQEPAETLFASRFFASTPQVIRQCYLRRGNSSLAEYGSLTDTSLCLTELLLLISLLIRCTNMHVCIHICMYKCANACTPTHVLTVVY